MCSDIGFASGASGARSREDGRPQGQDLRPALGLGVRQPSPIRGTPKLDTQLSQRVPIEGSNMMKPIF